MRSVTIGNPGGIPANVQIVDRKTILQPILVSTLEIYLTTTILVDRGRLASIYRCQITPLCFTIDLPTSKIRGKIQTFLVINENGFERKNRGGARRGTEARRYFLRSAAGMMRNERAKNSDSRKLLT